MAGLIALAIFDAGFWLLAVEPAATRTAADDRHIDAGVVCSVLEVQAPVFDPDVAQMRARPIAVAERPVSVWFLARLEPHLG